MLFYLDFFVHIIRFCSIKIVYSRQLISRVAQRALYIMKFVVRILKYSVAVVAVVCILLFTLLMTLRFDTVQYRLATLVSEEIEKLFGIPLEVEDIEVRSLNEVRLKNLLLKDLSGDTMVHANEVQAYLHTARLLRGEVKINTLILSAPDIRLNRETPDSPLNIQFVLDAFKGDNKEKKDIDLRINQISVYDGRFTYDVMSEATDSSRFDSNHIEIMDFTCNVSLKHLYKDELDVNVRSISGEEKCGFRIDKFKARLKRDGYRFVLNNLEVWTPSSNIASGSLELRADSTWSKLSLYGDVASDCFTPDEIAPFVNLPKNKIPQLAFNVDGYYSNDSIDIILSAATLDHDIDIDAKAQMAAPLTSERCGKVVVEKCYVNEEMLAEVFKMAKIDNAGYDIVSKLGNTVIKGELAIKKGSIETDATLSCRSGRLSAKGRLKNDGRYSVNLRAADLELERLSGVKDLESCNAIIDVSGNMHDGDDYANVVAAITDLKFKGYTYAPFEVEGKYTVNGATAQVVADDPSLKAVVTARYDIGDVNVMKLAMKTDTFKPYNLALLKTDKGKDFSFTLNGEYIDYADGRTIANAKVDNLRMTDNDGETFVRNFYISDNNSEADRKLIISSDFIQATIFGTFDFSTVVNSLKYAAESHLSAFDIPWSDKKKTIKEGKNEFYYDILINNSRPLTEILDLPITVHEPSNIEGSFSDSKKTYSIEASIKKLDLNGALIKAIDVKGKSSGGGLELDAMLQKSLAKSPGDSGNKGDNDDIVFNLNANIIESSVAAVLNWNNFKDDVPMKGRVRMNAGFSRDNDGNLQLAAKVYNDSIMHKNVVWCIDEGTVNGRMDSLLVENIGLHGNQQSLRIDGVAGKNDSDTLNVTLNNVDISTIFDLIKFRILKFGGMATGSATVTGLLSEINADGSLMVNDFSIDGAVMGTGDINVGWDGKSKSILIDAGIYNPENEKTTVKGLLSQADDTISLKIDANDLNVAFLNDKMRAFVSETAGVGSGKVHLHGCWRAIDFDGAVALNCETKVNATNVKYYFTGDSIKFSKGTMAFDNARVYDRYGNRGLLSGALNHKNLSNWTCNFNVIAEELLVYDTDDFGSLPFYGTVFGSGDALIKSDSNGFLLKANLSSDLGSRFLYDSNVASGARDNSFVSFTDESKQKKKRVLADKMPETEDVYKTTASKLTLDFMLDVNENLELKVFTNVQNDDYISLFGNGPINAVYNDKTGFNMKGNLDLVRGTYKFTIQDVFPKVFDIVKGGTIVFNGDPYKAALNLKTKYHVATASLSDLTTEVARRNSVKVDCIMNITGSLESPNLDFDLELPEASEDEREMLAGIASTPDQKNMQFLYLLAVGKFYTFDNDETQTNEANTSTVVESLISNTISSQLNNMLGKIINNGNWNISGNIANSERGWNSMEFEGALRGRLLNNRLQINGKLGYRENPIANKNFIGDFELQWLFSPKYNFSMKAYSKTNDRYFSKTDLTTQGVGASILFEFDSWKWWGKEKKTDKEKKKKKQKVEKDVVIEQENVTEPPVVVEQPDFLEIK